LSEAKGMVTIMNKVPQFTKDDLILFCFIGNFLLSYNIICYILRKSGVKISQRMLKVREMENPADLLQIVIAIFSIFISANLLNIFFG